MGQIMNASDITKSICKYRHKEEFTITNLKCGSTWFTTELAIMDLCAIKKSYSKPCITGYEVKVSRNDFLRDEKWPNYLQYCHRFSFACPKGIITKDDIRAIGNKSVGLVTINEHGMPYTAVKPVYRPIELDAEFMLAIIINRMDSDRIPFYSSKAEYMKDWYKNKISDSELGRHYTRTIAKRMVKQAYELERLQGKLERTNRFTSELKTEYNITDIWDIRRLISKFKDFEELFGNDTEKSKEAIKLLQKINSLFVVKEEPKDGE